MCKQAPAAAVVAAKSLLCAVVWLECAASVARGQPYNAPDLIEVTQNKVYRWNLDSPNNIYERDTQTMLFGDMTRLNDGRYVAYRGSFTGEVPALYQINPANGVVTQLVQNPNGAGQVIALAPLPSGQLLGYDIGIGYVLINSVGLSYSRRTIAFPSGTLRADTGSMAVAASGDIYAWCSGVNASGIYMGLFRINPINWTAVGIGVQQGVQSGGGFDAMSFTPDGRLFAFTEANAGMNGSSLVPFGIYEMNLQTGAATLRGTRGVLGDVRGVMFVPEPFTPAVLLSAITVACAARPRRQRS